MSVDSGKMIDTISESLVQAGEDALRLAIWTNTNIVLSVNGKGVEVAPQDIPAFISKHRAELLQSNS